MDAKNFNKQTKQNKKYLNPAGDEAKQQKENRKHL